MDNHSESDELRRLRSWLKANDIPLSTGYELFRKLGMKPVKIGRASYVTKDMRARFLRGIGVAA